MGRILSLVVVIYIIGICVDLAPIVRAEWNTAPASELASDVVAHLPEAAAWPVRLFDNLRNRPSEQP